MLVTVIMKIIVTYVLAFSMPSSREPDIFIGFISIYEHNGMSQLNMWNSNNDLSSCSGRVHWMAPKFS